MTACVDDTGRSLRKRAFRWAPDDVATRFSFERGDGSQSAALAAMPFGFHGIFNFPSVLSLNDLDQRIAVANDYAKSKVEWREMLHIRRAMYFPGQMLEMAALASDRR
jgi:hypothetical protein